MMVAVAGAVVSYGFLAFVGIAEFNLNWGAMIYSALTIHRGISSAMPWAQLLAPGLALSLFSAAFYFVSRGLHEVAEPQLRRK
jgi:ABC-type dipeptide/oligopeptide/nickel transport system permease subunit